MKVSFVRSTPPHPDISWPDLWIWGQTRGVTSIAENPDVTQDDRQRRWLVELEGETADGLRAFIEEVWGDGLDEAVRHEIDRQLGGSG